MGDAGITAEVLSACKREDRAAVCTWILDMDCSSGLLLSAKTDHLQAINNQKGLREEQRKQNSVAYMGGMTKCALQSGKEMDEGRYEKDL